MITINKFGGSILKNASDVKVISSVIKQNPQSINVFSAFYGITDALIKVCNIAKSGLEEYKMQLEMIESFHSNIAKELDISIDFITQNFASLRNVIDAIYHIADTSPKIMDKVLVCGEILSTKIVFEYFLKHNTNKLNNTILLNSQDIVKTNSFFGSAVVDISKTSKLLKQAVLHDGIYFAAGFIASDDLLNPTTLGRNGSDYTASLFASIVKSTKLTIWKDVDGVFTANPKIVDTAIQIDNISYKEMAELSYFGSSVVAVKALQPAIESNIAINIRSIYNTQNAGSIICNTTNSKMPIKGICSIDGVDLISVNGFHMAGISGFSQRIFSACKNANANVIFITQSSSEVSVCFGVRNIDTSAAIKSLQSEFKSELDLKVMNIEIKKNQSIIAIAGEGMSSVPGIAGMIFSNLGRANINITAIAQSLSEINISLAIDCSVANLAVKLIHNSIFENKKINCLLIGRGVVGASVIKMIESQNAHFKKIGINIDLVAIANSKEVSFKDSTSIKYSSFDEIIETFKQRVSINYALIDCTSSDLLVQSYQKFIQNGFNIITPNKKANTLDAKEFDALQACLLLHKKHFFYEANVGAGLPIISTIKDLINCGDEIIKIEGIFSGTLSYLFNNLTCDAKFSSIVQDAKQKGFTEPNPNDDLCGMDVARKLLILARMIGYKINLADIEIQSLVGISDDEILKLSSNAQKQNSVLRYVGTIQNGKANAKMISVLNDNPLASTKYTDNIISITTKFYNNTPLVIRGPGAGADVTAIGIVSDIIKLSGII